MLGRVSQTAQDFASALKISPRKGNNSGRIHIHGEEDNLSSDHGYGSGGSQASKQSSVSSTGSAADGIQHGKAGNVKGGAATENSTPENSLEVKKGAAAAKSELSGAVSDSSVSSLGSRGSGVSPDGRVGQKEGKKNSLNIEISKGEEKQIEDPFAPEPNKGVRRTNTMGAAPERKTGALGSSIKLRKPSTSWQQRKLSVQNVFTPQAYKRPLPGKTKDGGLMWFGLDGSRHANEKQEEERNSTNSSADEASTGDNSARAALRKKRILIINPLGLVSWVAPRLSDHPYKVVVAASPSAAMELLLSNKFWLVIADLHMPTMNGLEFCRQLRRQQVEPFRTAVLIHVTSPGTIRSDVLEAFLSEDLVDLFTPQPLDTSTLFNFLKNSKNSPSGMRLSHEAGMRGKVRPSLIMGRSNHLIREALKKTPFLHRIRGPELKEDEKAAKFFVFRPGGDENYTKKVEKGSERVTR